MDISLINYRESYNSGRRSILLSLALSILAIICSTLILPILVGEMDKLNEWVAKENTMFKATTDKIWHDLMLLQSRIDHAQFSRSHLSIPLNRRQKRNPQKQPFEHIMMPPESANFLNRLERKSYKGRQRLQKKLSVQLPYEQPDQTYTWHTETITAQDSEAQQLLPVNCPKGLPGPDGIPGFDGVPGTNGLSGRPGIPGKELYQLADGYAKCFKCPAGKPGPVGLSGLPGMPGEPGPDGAPGIMAVPLRPGPPGPIGDSGPDGANGLTGADGEPGLPGIRYLKGVPGLKGEPGLVGELGPRGDRGIAGPDGEPGPAGFDGHQGIPGANGTTGLPGGIGSSGFPGAEKHYCNCPIRSLYLKELRARNIGVNEYLSRYKDRKLDQLQDEHNLYAESSLKDFHIFQIPPFLRVL